MEPNEYSENLDEFGENRLISRLNRRFSTLLHQVFRLPLAWEGLATQNFKRHLSRLNNSALTVLFFAGIISGILCMALGLKQDSSILFFAGIGIIPGVFLIQFVLGLFCSANLRLTFGPPIRLASRLLPEVFAVLGILNFIYTLIWGSLTAIAGYAVSLSAGLATTGVAFAGLVMAGYISWVATNCEKLLDVSTDDEQRQGPAEYLFNLVTFFGRLSLSLVPINFAAFVFLASAGTIYFGAMQFGEEGVGITLLMQSGIENFSIFLYVILMGLFPIFAHFCYLGFLVIADIGMAFFRLVKSTEHVSELSAQAMENSPDGES